MQRRASQTAHRTALYSVMCSAALPEPHRAAPYSVMPRFPSRTAPHAQHRCLLRRKMYFTITCNPSGKTNITGEVGVAFMLVL